MKRLVILCIVTLIIPLLVAPTLGCQPPSPAPIPTPSPVPVPTPEFSNSESASKIAELEAKIRQLEAENQRLLAENRRLNDDLREITSQLQVIRSLVTSSSYRNTLSNLSEVQNASYELAYFVEGLPDLPPLPPGLTPSKIEQMVEMAGVAYWLIYHLPPLPPFPPELAELEAKRQLILDIFEFVGDLRPLPQFLSGTQSLEELRLRIETYLSGVQDTVSRTKAILEQIEDATSS